MRFLGLVLVMLGVAVTYFFGIIGTGNIANDITTMRLRLAQLTNIPGLAPPNYITKTMVPVHSNGSSGTTSGLPSPAAGLPPGTVLA